MRKFAYKKRTDRQTVQRLRPLYPLWILEGVGQLFPTTIASNIVINNFLDIICG